jgi:hypothetical protein
VPEGRDEDLARVVDVLVAEDQTHVYAGYWTAMNLQFVAGDELTVGSLILPERFLAERRAVDAHPHPVWVASHGVNTDDVAPLRAALDAAGVSYRARTVGLAVIFDRLDPVVRPEEVGLGVEAPA